MENIRGLNLKKRIKLRVKVEYKKLIASILLDFILIVEPYWFTP